VKVVHIQFRTDNPLQYRLDYWLEHCLLAVAFFLPLSLNIASVFLASAAVLWFSKMAVTRQLRFKRTPFDLLIIILVGLSAASIFASPDRGFSFYNYYHLMGRYILLYYLVVNNVHNLEQLKRLMLAMLISALVVTVYGFYQYLYGGDISALEWVDGEQFPELKLRVFSTLENPNLLAGFLVVMMALGTGLCLCLNEIKLRLALAGFVAMLGGCLILTYSRGAWLSVVVVIIVCGVLYNRKLLWLLLALPLLALGAHDAVLERFASILNPTDTSSTLRLALWESTLAMISDRPLLGIGWGAYWLVYPQYDFFVQDASTKIFHAHNMYLNIAAEIGIPGLLTFLAIWYGHLRIALTIRSRTADNWLAGLMLGVIGAFLSLFVSGFTDFIMFNIQLSMLFWLLSALVVITWQEIIRYSS
jgi:putative inorganic carbon (HCO3(-)) transporter